MSDDASPLVTAAWSFGVLVVFLLLACSVIFSTDWFRLSVGSLW